MIKSKGDKKKKHVKQVTATLFSEASDYSDESRSDGDTKKDSEPTKKKANGRAFRCVVKHVVDKESCDVERYLSRIPGKGLSGGEREELIAPEKVVVKTTQIYGRKLAGDTPAYMARGTKLLQEGNQYL